MADDTSADSEIEAVKERILETVELWKTIGATPIPSTLKEAREKRWELATDAVQVGALLSYPSDDQEADSQRVMKLEKAIEIIDVFEAEMIADLVIRPDNILVQVKGMVEKAVTAIYNTVRFLWRYPNARRALWALLRDHPFLTGGATILIAAIKRVAATRGSIEKEMRKKALPQRPGPRYVRRKVSRR